MTLQTQYNQAVKTFKDLAPNQLIPTFESIKITKAQMAYIEKHPGQLVITPALEFYHLIEQIDKKQKTPTYIFKELWDQYDLGSELRVDYVVDELMFTDQSYEDQRKSLAKTKTIQGEQVVDPRAYFMAQAIRRDNNQELLDQLTFRRFIQLPPKTVVGDSWVGVANSHGGQLWVDRSYGFANPRGGVGFSVGLDFDTSTLELPESFSSEFPDELMINLKTYRAMNPILCIVLKCNMEAKYIFKGYSLCVKHFKEQND